jgi:hypothetical protein
MTDLPDIPGLAALAVCESLLLALNDRDIMPERTIVGVLKDAAKALEAAPRSEGQPASHVAAALLIHKIIDGHNSVRRP